MNVSGVLQTEYSLVLYMGQADFRPKSKPTANATNSAADGVGNKDEVVGTDIGGDAATKWPGGGHRRYVSIFPTPIFNC
jgi:hypothetical protein